MEVSGRAPEPQVTSTNAAWDQDTPTNATFDQDTPTNATFDPDTPINATFDQDTPTNATFDQDTPTNAACEQDKPTNATCDQDTPESTTCDPCEFAGDTQEAEFYCTECDEFMCFVCAQTHKKLRATRNHNLLVGRDLPRKRPSLHAEIKCIKHEDKPFDYFCNAHNAVCCSVCVTLEHRSCEVEFILDHVDKFKNGGEYEALLQKLKELEKLVQDVTSEEGRNVATATRVSDNIVDEIRKFRTEINDKLDSLEHKALERAKIIKKRNIKTMSDLTSELDTMKAQIDETTTTLENLHSLKQHKQLIITAAKLSKASIAALENRITELSKENTISEYQFRRNEEFVRFINSTLELGTIEEIVKGIDEGNERPGHLSDKNTVLNKQKTKPLTSSSKTQTETKTLNNSPQKQTETTTLNTSPQTQNETTTLNAPSKKQTDSATLGKSKQKQYNTRPLNIKHQKSINIQTNSSLWSWLGLDIDCRITGSIVLDSSRLALVDHRNSSVKILDMTQSNITHYLKLESRPWDITQTDQGQPIVTCPYIHSLIFINIVGKTLIVDRKHNVGGACYGIDYGKDMFIVSFKNPRLMKLIKTDGQTVRTISTDSSGNPLFDYPTYVVFSKDNQSIYVSDSNKDSITHLDINGTVLGVYTCKELTEPVGVTVDRHNNVYIAGWSSGNICVLTAGSTQIQPVVKVDRPHSVLVCDDSDQMIVGRVSNELTVYKMH